MRETCQRATGRFFPDLGSFSAVVPGSVPKLSLFPLSAPPRIVLDPESRGGMRSMGSSTGREASTDPSSWGRCPLYGRSSIRRSNPFARSLAGQMRAHDDRKDLLAGIDLILRGTGSPRRIQIEAVSDR